ncbi:hypothetical protein MBH78_09125 [Oceanimonas sp. NS1]|nr:hypothetical protein [Oceanimonas sp. NS1]
MGQYFLRRLLLLIPTFLGITLVVFAITRFVPGGPVERMLMESQLAGSEFSQSSRGGQVLSSEQIDELKEFYGLDKPVGEAYLDWLGKLVRLDLGSPPVTTCRCGS